jgi:HD-GYP domain-containing protein (c-di-GMP phosphodiesterase class II)
MAEFDHGLAGHATHVGELAIAVGRRLGFDEDELSDLRIAADLHDIGKIAIPDDILYKPGLLDEEEWSFIRRHTLIGERIVGSTLALRKVATLIRSAHERWDGRGYPDGLVGEAIPLASRIIFACDAYDAMTRDRPYRTALTQEHALGELSRGAGTQFDPRIVRALREALTEGMTPSGRGELDNAHGLK